MQAILISLPKTPEKINPLSFTLGNVQRLLHIPPHKAERAHTEILLTKEEQAVCDMATD